MAKAAPIEFADAGAYERFMGRWSRAVAPRFLRWIEPPARARWLDAGCGTGILAEALLHLCDPTSVVGIDPAAAQIEQSALRVQAPRARFEKADAMSLPFADASFDVAASALVLNFVPDPLRALREMRRVAAPGGIVAGYVWDFGRELSPSGPLRRAMRACGTEPPAVPGTAHSSLEALEALFRDAGLAEVRSCAFDVTLGYAGFDEFWEAQTPGYAPTTKVIRAMSEPERRRLKRAALEALAAGPGGRIEYAARANAVRAKVRA